MYNPITITADSDEKDFIRFGFFDGWLGIKNRSIGFETSARQKCAYNFGLAHARQTIDEIAKQIPLMKGS